MENTPDDKAKKAAYMRAWHHKRKNDPEYRAKRVAYQKAYMDRKLAENPAHKEEMRAYMRAYQKKRRAEDPEYAAQQREYGRRAKAKIRAEDPVKARDQWHSWALKTKYGITLDDYNVMLAEQGGVCAICGGNSLQGKTRLHVDHCHTTGEVRSILCGKCNGGLGLFMDDPDLLEAAAAYLRAHRRKRLRLVS